MPNSCAGYHMCIIFNFHKNSEEGIVVIWLGDLWPTEVKGLARVLTASVRAEIQKVS